MYDVKYNNNKPEGVRDIFAGEYNMIENEKQKYAKPELNGLGDQSGKLSDEELGNVAGGVACREGTSAADTSSDECALGDTAGETCRQGNTASNHCYWGDSASSNCRSGETAGDCGSGHSTGVW